MTLRIGSLFAGMCGLDIAVESVIESEVAWVSEFDAHPSRILAHRYPHAPNLGDVTKINWSAVEPVDIITGGSPCQDLSHAGKRAGMKSGTRSGLWASMCDAIDIIRPRLVVWENVRGALSAEATAGDVESCEFCVGDERGPSLRALGRVLGDLAELGYDAAWTGLRAADVGAPHGRWRVFVLAWPADSEGDEGRLEYRDGAALATPDGRMTLLGTPRAADGMRGPLRDPNSVLQGGRARLEDQISLLRTPTAQLAVNGGSQHPDKRKAGGHGPTLADEIEHLLPTPRATDGTKGGPNQRGSSGDLMLPSAVTLLPTPTSADSKASGAAGYAKTSTHNPGVTLTDATVRQPDRWGDYAPAVARWEALTRPAPAPTEPTGKGGAHRLSARFVEWLMGLPDGWVTEPAIWEGVKPSTARNAQLKALGNGVVPQQAAAALRHLLGLRSASLDLAL